MKNLAFKFSDQNNNDITNQVNLFGKAIGLETAVSDRYSSLFLINLFTLTQAEKIDPIKIVRQIQSLENLKPATGLKPATIFKRHPLKGLWHQHYHKDGLQSYALNLKNGLDKYGIPYIEDKIKKSELTGEDFYLTEADIAEIARDVTRNYERRQSDSALTGEWIIFAKYQEQNYYLCLAEHSSGDQYIRQQIDSICAKEFPFLSQILSN